MFFKLTDEQMMIQTMVREFSRKVVAPRLRNGDRTKAFPAENFEKMAELGLMGMMIPWNTTVPGRYRRLRAGAVGNCL